MWYFHAVYDFYTIFYPNDLYLFSFNKRFRAIRTKRRKTTTTTKYEMFRGFLNCLKGTPGFISNFQSKIWIKMIETIYYSQFMATYTLTESLSEFWSKL